MINTRRPLPARTRRQGHLDRDCSTNGASPQPDEAWPPRALGKLTNTTADQATLHRTLLRLYDSHQASRPVAAIKARQERDTHRAAIETARATLTEGHYRTDTDQVLRVRMSKAGCSTPPRATG